MEELHFRPGETVFREGETSDRVCRIVAGSAEVIRIAGGNEIVIGIVGPGEYVGEMGVLEGRPRSATVRARDRLQVETLGREEFIRQVGADGELSMQLLHRLSARLRTTDNALADALSGDGEPAPREDGRGAPTRGPAPAEGPVLRLFAGSDRLASVLPAGGLVIRRLPWVVGRAPDAGEPDRPVRVDLPVPEKAPWRMSRTQFALMRTPEGPVVRDLDSRLGTTVNGTAIGSAFSLDAATLAPGENLIVAGGVDSPLVFRLVLETD